MTDIVAATANAFQAELDNCCTNASERSETEAEKQLVLAQLTRTDKQVFTDLLKMRGIGFEEVQVEEVTKKRLPKATSGILTGSWMEGGIGYDGFYTVFFFDKDEKIVGHGEWE